MQTPDTLITIRASDLANYPRPTLEERSKRWGGWRLEHRYLAYPAYVGGDYPINLDRFTSSAQVLDMIAQVSMKNWATPECVAGLIRAINDLLHLQGRLCGCGRDMRLTPALGCARPRGRDGGRRREGLRNFAQLEKFFAHFSRKILLRETESA
jgi:hypothetical protein